MLIRLVLCGSILHGNNWHCMQNGQWLRIVSTSDWFYIVHCSASSSAIVHSSHANLNMHIYSFAYVWARVDIIHHCPDIMYQTVSNYGPKNNWEYRHWVQFRAGRLLHFYNPDSYDKYS